MNLRMATLQMAGIRVPPKVRTLPTLKKRLAVAITFEPPQVIEIRHAVPNMGTKVIQSRTLQGPRA